MFNIDHRGHRRRLSASIAVALVFVTSCDSATELRMRPLPAAQPLQVAIRGEPGVSYTYTVGDEENWEIAVDIQTQDSTLHALWRPTAIHVGVRGKGSFDDFLIPLNCLEARSEPYPANFVYYMCDEVFLRHARALSPREIRDLEDHLGGSEMVRSGSPTDPQGVLYIFKVPVRREAVEEATQRLLDYSGTIAAGKWAVDVVCLSPTEPPCIPWIASKSYSNQDFGGIVLEDGDTLDITYSQASGQLVTAVRIVHVPAQLFEPSQLAQ